jgi:hypothetical protein
VIAGIGIAARMAANTAGVARVAKPAGGLLKRADDADDLVGGLAGAENDFWETPPPMPVQVLLGIAQMPVPLGLQGFKRRGDGKRSGGTCCNSSRRSIGR